MCEIIHINLNDKPSMALNAHTGMPGVLDNKYPTPPGVADDLWRRLLVAADSQVSRDHQPGTHVYSPAHLDVIKFRKAYMRLLVLLREARPDGTAEQQTLHARRAQ